MNSEHIVLFQPVFLVEKEVVRTTTTRWPMWRWINYCHRTWSWTWNAMFFFGVSNTISCTSLWWLEFDDSALLMLFIAVKCSPSKSFLLQIVYALFVYLAHCKFLVLTTVHVHVSGELQPSKGPLFIIALSTNAVCTSEMSVYFCKIMWHHIPEGCDIHLISLLHLLSLSCPPDVIITCDAS
jgi:hypothetical protein